MIYRFIKKLNMKNSEISKKLVVGLMLIIGGSILLSKSSSKTDPLNKDDFSSRFLSLSLIGIGTVLVLVKNK